MKPIKAWYFSDSTKKLRFGDDRDIVLGETHEHDGDPVLCERGLHASTKILDALDYAPGNIVWRVELSGKIITGDDKIVATRRKYIAGGIDIEKTLRLFARMQALSVIDKWDCPEIVRRWLDTGDESIMSAAESMARFAVLNAAESAAESAAEYVTLNAARAAVLSAARSAAPHVALSAAESAVRAAAPYVALSAALYAAVNAVRATVLSVARSAAESPARSAANKMLTKMVKAEIKAHTGKE